MRLKLVAHNVGLVLLWFAAAMSIPLAVDWIYGFWIESAGFALGIAVAVVVGLIARSAHGGAAELRRLEGIAVVALTWLGVATVGAIPYVWSGFGVLDALFESMSGFTTTGATIITDFGAHSHGLFFWRGMTQWFGGMGVIALFIAVLPKLAIAGRQMFFAEAPGPEEERLTPRIRATAIRLWSLYVGLTALEAGLLWAAGLPLYDAVCNSLTTLAAGGFSPHAESIGGYGNAVAEWIFIAFMFLAGANFSLQFRALRGQPGRLFRDEEFRAYVAIVLVAAVFLTGALWTTSRALPEGYAEAPGAGILQDASPETLVRQSLFQTLTVVTTTGFATDDFELWNGQAKAVLLVLMFVGGCAGSAAGGPKVVRLLIVGRFASSRLFKTVHPRAVRPPRYGGRAIPDRVLQDIVAFLFLYVGIFALSVLVVVSRGADLMTGITASIATLGNIGPGFGAVGPMASYADFDAVSKVMLFLNMWIGRLEVITVLVLFHPHSWRRAT